MMMTINNHINSTIASHLKVELHLPMFGWSRTFIILTSRNSCRQKRYITFTERDQNSSEAISQVYINRQTHKCHVLFMHHEVCNCLQI